MQLLSLVVQHRQSSILYRKLRFSRWSQRELNERVFSPVFFSFCYLYSIQKVFFLCWGDIGDCVDDGDNKIDDETDRKAMATITARNNEMNTRWTCKTVVRMNDARQLFSCHRFDDDHVHTGFIPLSFIFLALYTSNGYVQMKMKKMACHSRARTQRRYNK